MLMLMFVMFLLLIDKHVGCSTSSSIESDICALKKSVNCLGSTLSQFAINHTRLESMFRTKQVPPMHAHKPRYTHGPHVHTHNTMYAHVYTCVGPMAFHSSFDDDQHSCSYVY